jgi:hypothetical protein
MEVSMENDQSTPRANDQTSPQSERPRFEKMLDDLKTTVSRFQDDTTPENFAAIVSTLSTFGISGAQVWGQVADYSKRHPLRVAIGAAIMFFAVKGIVREVPKHQEAMIH